MVTIRPLTALVLTAGFALAAPTLADWLRFDDDTATRLVLSTLRDDPGGNPRQDDQEKDIGVADLDRDGWTDVIVVRKRPFSVAGVRQDILLMNEEGVLVDRTAELAPGFKIRMTDARDVFIADFTGDVWEDVVIINTFGDQPVFYRNAGNDGGGEWLGLVEESFRLPPIQVPGDVEVLQFCAVWGGDINGDGALDLFLSNYRALGGTRDVLLINDGDGFFVKQTPPRLGSYANVAFGTSGEIHDVDGDGDQDIIKISTLYEAPPFPVGQFILFNDGNGKFNSVPFQEVPNQSPYMFTAGDLDGDGIVDMYNQGDFQDRVLIARAADPDRAVDYDVHLMGNGRTGGFGGNTKMADLDGDGDLDVGVGPIDVDIANCGFSGDFTLLQNPGDGRLFDPWAGQSDRNFHIDPHDFGFLDIDNNGCMDIVMGLCTGWRVFTSQYCFPLALPISGLGFRAGTQTGGDLESLGASDDSYLTARATRTGPLWRIDLGLTLDTPADGLGTIDVTLELAADIPGPGLVVMLLNRESGAWNRIGNFPLGTEDRLESLSVADGRRYVANGKVAMRLVAAAAGEALPDGFGLRIDQVELLVSR